MALRGRLGRLGALAAALLAGTASSAVLADVTTDGTLGRKVKLTGRNVEVGADLGQVRGKNLFHSFERFGVPTKGKVTFTGPGGLDNVVSRVTGASRPRSTARSPPGARRGRLPREPERHLFGRTRARRAGLVPRQHRRRAALLGRRGLQRERSGPGGLSVARPEAFGFLGGRPAAITANGAFLSVPAGEAMSLVGGDIAINASQLSAGGGTVTLAGLGGAGSADVAAGEVEGDVSATVALDAGSVVIATGEGGGQVLVRAGGFLVTGGSQVFNGTGDQDTDRGITVEAREVLVSGDPP
jgi:hypothetical protein